jgi:hypothetical protein
VINAIGVGDQIANSAIRNATLQLPPLFISRYFRDERNRPLKLKQFHVDIINAVLDPEIKKLLIMLPAGHGKTTIISRMLPTYLMTKDPNLRIMHIMNNATDAEQNLAAIQREMEDQSSLLVREHGPFKGRVWKTTEFHLAARTVVDKDPSFAAYGTGSNVFGHRADLVICDDILNLENSGPNVTDRTRQSVRDWFFQGVTKVAAPFGKVVVVGTAMDFRDLYQELQDPKHGYHVIKLQAIIDDSKQEVLWPERFSWKWLDSERQSDMTAFMKRFQNIALEESLLTFPMIHLEQCRDMNRPSSLITEEMRQAGLTVVINGFDPTSGQTKASKWCGFAAIAFNPKQPDPKEFKVLELRHFRAPLEEQVKFLIEKHRQYNARATVIEANGAHQYVMQSTELRTFSASGNAVLPHYTHEKNKPDPFVGIPAIAELVKAHLLRFPFGDEDARKWIGLAFEKEFGMHPMSETTDMMMALWFAWLKARELSARPNRVVLGKPLPKWAWGHGMNTPKRQPVLPHA